MAKYVKSWVQGNNCSSKCEWRALLLPSPKFQVVIVVLVLKKKTNARTSRSYLWYVNLAPVWQNSSPSFETLTSTVVFGAIPTGAKHNKVPLSWNWHWTLSPPSLDNGAATSKARRRTTCSPNLTRN